MGVPTENLVSAGKVVGALALTALAVAGFGGVGAVGAGVTGV